MLGIHRHGELLGGTNAERQKRRRAGQKHAAELELEDVPRGQPAQEGDAHDKAGPLILWGFLLHARLSAHVKAACHLPRPAVAKSEALSDQL